jgi:hypothetical protein
MLALFQSQRFIINFSAHDANGKSFNPSTARQAWEILSDLYGRESEQTMTLRVATCEILCLVQCHDVNLWRMQPANGHHTAGGHGFTFPTPGWRSKW